MPAKLHFLKLRLRFIANPSKNDIFLTPLINIFWVIPYFCGFRNAEPTKERSIVFGKTDGGYKFLYINFFLNLFR